MGKKKKESKYWDLMIDYINISEDESDTRTKKGDSKDEYYDNASKEEIEDIFETSLNSYPNEDFTKNSKSFVKSETGGLNRESKKFKIKKPSAFKIAEYIISEHEIRAVNALNLLFLYNPKKGIYDQVNIDNFGVFLDKMLKKSKARANITPNMVSKVFKILLCNHSIQTNYDLFERNEDFINTMSGIVNIKTDEVYEYNSNYGFLHRLPLYFDEQCSTSELPPQFKAFVERVTEKSETEKFLQSLAYFILNKNCNRTIFCWNCTDYYTLSLCKELISCIIGKQRISHISLNDIAKRKITPLLLDKSLNIFEDSSKINSKSLSIIHSLITDSYIDIQTNNQIMKVHCKIKLLFINPNETIFEENSIKNCQFVRFVPVKTFDITSIQQMIADEGSKILSILVNILHSWYNNDFTFIQPQKQFLFNDQRASLECFINDMCMEIAYGRESIRNLCDAYKDYCYKNDLPAFSPIKFIKQLLKRDNLSKEKFYIGTKQVRGILGIQLTL